MPKPVSATLLRKLEKAAKAAAALSYSPYSNFAVGAAILTEDGTVVSGCNVENASYGLCNCAERTAIFSAAAQGHRRIKCVVVYTPTPKPTAPCGACRQVIYEFGADARVVSVSDGPERIDSSIGALLPRAFGPSDLA